MTTVGNNFSYSKFEEEETILDLLIFLTLLFNSYTLPEVSIPLVTTLFELSFLMQHPLKLKITCLPTSTI